MNLGVGTQMIQGFVFVSLQMVEGDKRDIVNGNDLTCILLVLKRSFVHLSYNIF